LRRKHPRILLRQEFRGPDRRQVGFLSERRTILADWAKHSVPYWASQRGEARAGCTFATLHLFVQRFAFDRAATQKPALALGKVVPRMNGAAVVPHHEIAEPPDMFEDELAALADFVELFENS